MSRQRRALLTAAIVALGSFGALPIVNRLPDGPLASDTVALALCGVCTVALIIAATLAGNMSARWSRWPRTLHTGFVLITVAAGAALFALHLTARAAFTDGAPIGDAAATLVLIGLGAGAAGIALSLTGLLATPRPRANVRAGAP